MEQLTLSRRKKVTFFFIVATGRLKAVSIWKLFGDLCEVSNVVFEPAGYLTKAVFDRLFLCPGSDDLCVNAHLLFH